MKRSLWAIHLVALASPILLAGITIFLLGWPKRFPYPAAHIVVFFWLVVTAVIGFKRRNSQLSPAYVSIANRALIGCSVGTFILGLVFLAPSVVVECGIVYYHYPVPAIDVWV